VAAAWPCFVHRVLRRDDAGSARWGQLAARFGLPAAHSSPAAGALVRNRDRLDWKLLQVREWIRALHALAGDPVLAIAPRCRRGPVLVRSSPPRNATRAAHCPDIWVNRRRRDGAMLGTSSRSGRTTDLLETSWVTPGWASPASTIADDQCGTGRSDGLSARLAPRRKPKVLTHPRLPSIINEISSLSSARLFVQPVLESTY